MSNLLPLPRELLAKFGHDQRTIRFFEELQRRVGVQTPDELTQIRADIAELFSLLVSPIRVEINIPIVTDAYVLSVADADVQAGDIVKAYVLAEPTADNDVDELEYLIPSIACQSLDGSVTMFVSAPDLFYGRYMIAYEVQ